MVANRISHCAQILRRQDPDRYLTVLFAPLERREALFALYAFNLEVARIRESVREPIMGQMRLQWWRDSLSELREGRVRSHEVLKPLAAAIEAYHLDIQLLDRLIDARERDMEPGPPADMAELLRYAEGTSSTLVELALEVLGEPAPAVREAGRNLGIAWALVGLLRAIPFHAAQHRIYLPATIAAEAGLDLEQPFERGASPALKKAVQSVACEAGHWLARARQRRSEVARRFQPALLPAVLAEGHLRRLAAAGYDPFAAGVQQPPPGRIWNLALRRALGSY
jgi:NADH dehydrogenase [ubiquinone] 1 alpha subcomplex assembly factor 6